MVISEQLAQTRPSGTSAVSALAGLYRKDITVYRIVVSNTSAASANYSIYHDADAATFDQTTALMYTIPLGSGATEMIDFDTGGVVVRQPGHIGVQTSVASALTFTLYGQGGV